MTPNLITLQQINSLPLKEAAALLQGLYEHSEWIAEQALDTRPFASPAALKYAMVQVLQRAGRGQRVATLAPSHI